MSDELWLYTRFEGSEYQMQLRKDMNVCGWDVVMFLSKTLPLVGNDLLRFVLRNIRLVFVFVDSLAFCVILFVYRHQQHSRTIVKVKTMSSELVSIL